MNTNIIDLTLPFDHTIAGVKISPAKTLEKDGWNASTLELYSHAGTHMDAPYHFGVTDQRIDQMPVRDMIGRAWVIRIRDVQPAQLLTVEDLGATANRFNPGDSLLLMTNWSHRLGTDAYRNQLPRIGAGLAQWCVENKVNMLGVEPPSVADVNNLEEVTAIHRILLGGGVTIIEGLCGLDQIRADHVQLIALPLKIKNGDGAPARVIAIEET